MNDCFYKLAYEHFVRQIERRWPEHAGCITWDEMAEDMRDCWRAGFDEYTRLAFDV